MSKKLIVDRSQYRRTVFATEKSQAIDLLASSFREEMLATRYLQGKRQQSCSCSNLEAEKARDAIRLSSLLLSQLAAKDNAALEQHTSARSRGEAQHGLINSKQETADAIRTSLSGLMTTHVLEKDCQCRSTEINSKTD